MGGAQDDTSHGMGGAKLLSKLGGCASGGSTCTGPEECLFGPPPCFAWHPKSTPTAPVATTRVLRDVGRDGRQPGAFAGRGAHDAEVKVGGRSQVAVSIWPSHVRHTSQPADRARTRRRALLSRPRLHAAPQAPRRRWAREGWLPRTEWAAPW